MTRFRSLVEIQFTYVVYHDENADLHEQIRQRVLRNAARLETNVFVSLTESDDEADLHKEAKAAAEETKRIHESFIRKVKDEDGEVHWRYEQ